MRRVAAAHRRTLPFVPGALLSMAMGDSMLVAMLEARMRREYLFDVARSPKLRALLEKMHVFGEQIWQQ